MTHAKHHARHRVHEGEHNANVIHHETLSAQERLGLFITERVGTMWCAYVFMALALVAFPAAVASRDPLIIVTWISQSFLQLVLLSVIMVGQNAQSRHQEVQSEVDHHINETLLRLQEEQMIILKTGLDTRALAEAILSEWDAEKSHARTPKG